VLQAKNIKPKLPLEKDLELTDQAMSYEGSARRSSVTITRADGPARAASTPSHSSANAAVTTWPLLPNGAPDFETMNPAQRLAYDHHRLSRKFG
jgi:hypothetical protein